MDRLAPIHPGEVLLEDFINGFGITQHKLAVAIGVPPRRINEIVHGTRRITADTALRLGRYFGSRTISGSTSSRTTTSSATVWALLEGQRTGTASKVNQV